MTHDINPVEVDRSEVCERQKLGRSEVVDSTEDAAQDDGETIVRIHARQAVILTHLLN